MPSDTDPVIVGIADIINRTTTPLEPLDLISSAVTAALSDASVPDIKAAVTHLTVVHSWTWPYPDLPSLVASRTGLAHADLQKRLTPLGGNSPVKALDEACRLIAAGDEGIHILAGGEALGTLVSSMKATGAPPPSWTPIPTDMAQAFSPTIRDLPDDLGGRHGLGAPVQVYPLYENAWRAVRGQTRAENHAESARLYARFAAVAARREVAAIYGRETTTEERLRTVDGGNRMICYPYPMLMNAFNNVNLAAAVVVTSVRTARRLGIDQSRWAYVLGAAGTSESADFWQRPSFERSPAIEESIDAALTSAQLQTSDIQLIDFYSCFPIVPKLAAAHMGLPLDRELTLLGGLTSFGGAGNNYSMHALTEATRQLRESQTTTNALILANGGVLTYQHAAVLSSAPRQKGRYPVQALLPALLDDHGPALEKAADGDAVVETFTVDYARSGEPKKGHIVGRLKDGKRFLANARDRTTMDELVAERAPEPIGRRGKVKAVGRRNVFWFEDKGKL